jgi:TfoX/Sxy family transcriptional regulator of competence genes
MNPTPAQKRKEMLTEKYKIEEEILLAHDLMRAFPELSYVEAMRHAYARLRKEREKL